MQFSQAIPLQTKLKRSLGRRLLQLRFRFFQRHRYDRLTLEEIHGKPFLVLPQVFNPGLFETSKFLTQTLNARLIPPGSRVLDMGSGSGVGAVFAARWTQRVVAVDINPSAVRCARINVLLNQLEDRVDVRQGDLFAPVAGQRFDVVLFNPPFFRGVPRDALDRAWRSLDVVERFASELPDHLMPNGYALVVLSTNGEADAFLRAFRANRFDFEIVVQREWLNELVTIYRLTLAKG